MYKVVTSEWTQRKKAKNRDTEEYLLHWYSRKFGGVMFAEVPFGDEEQRQKHDRIIDAVRFLRHRGIREIETYRGQMRKDFENHLRKAAQSREKVELVEVKRELNRSVIGQVMVAEYLVKEWEKRAKLKRRANLRKVIVVGGAVQMLRKFCKLHGIDVLVHKTRRGMRTKRIATTNR